jgi:hypothetical protein
MNKEIQKHFKNNVTRTFIIYFFEIYFCYYMYILWMCLLYIYTNSFGNVKLICSYVNNDFKNISPK